IIQAWKDYFVVLKTELQHVVGNISFTIDIWSLDSRQPYLAMTAHYIVDTSNALQYRSMLVVFHRLRSKHTGKALACTVL
ncbi:hypothetical protein PISMIDRAFT_47771, partial [Pisolithus microcarpus 441]